MIVFGLGSGRSGTKSLQKLLNCQSESVCFHEANPSAMAWEKAESTALSILNDFQTALDGGKRAIAIEMAEPHFSHREQALERYRSLPRLTLVGDVASYYLPYVQTIVNHCDDVRFPCLKRDRQETVESFLTKADLTSPKRREIHRWFPILKHVIPGQMRNHWVEHNGKKWVRDARWDKCFPKFADAGSISEAIGRYWDEYYQEAARLSRQHPRQVAVFDISMLKTASGQSEILHFCGLSKVTVVNSVHENRNKL